jgi:hypothetical protein
MCIFQTLWCCALADFAHGTGVHFITFSGIGNMTASSEYVAPRIVELRGAAEGEGNCEDSL